MRTLVYLILTAMLILIGVTTRQPEPAVAAASTGTWQVNTEPRPDPVDPGKLEEVVNLYFGNAEDNWPQYGVLHQNSGFLRLNYGPENSAWGTSIVLLPSFWSGGVYYQGALVNTTWKGQGTSRLELTLTSIIHGLEVTTVVTLDPPVKNQSLTAHVHTTVVGDVPLDDGRKATSEAFKPVVLSSMHVSDTQWDTQQAYACLRTASIPPSGWIHNPAVIAGTFGLVGGTSEWQNQQQGGKPAPTVEIILDRARPITGWVTDVDDPDQENVAYWAATDEVLSGWSYWIRVAPDPGPKLGCLGMSGQATPRPVEDGAELTYQIQVTNTSGITLAPTITLAGSERVTPTGPFTWTPTILPGGVWSDTQVVTVQADLSGALRTTAQVTTTQGLSARSRIGVCVNACFTYLPVVRK